MIVHGRSAELRIGDMVIGEAIEWRVDWSPTPPPDIFESFPALRTVTGTLSTVLRVDARGMRWLYRARRRRAAAERIAESLDHAQAGRRRRGSNGWR